MIKHLAFLSILVATTQLKAEIAVESNEYDVKDDEKIGYEVPVTDPKLLPFARFPMSSKVTFEDGQWSFRYHLPWEIVSKDANIPGIKFTTTKKISDNVYEVEGPHAYGDCTFAGKVSKCHLFYDLKLNAETTKSDLAKQFSGEELAARSIVAEQFARDPEGFLLFEAP